MTSKVWGKILNLMKRNIVSFQGHIVSQKCLQSNIMKHFLHTKLLKSAFSE